MKRLGRLIVVLSLFVPACAAAPTPAQQAGVGALATAYQVCIVQASMLDAGKAERVANYERCADAVDRVFTSDAGQ